jgi:hypothetical protein
MRAPVCARAAAFWLQPPLCLHSVLRCAACAVYDAASPPLPPFFSPQSFESTSSALTVTLSQEALQFLVPGEGNQFRATLHPDTFSNFNGAFRQPIGEDNIRFHGSSASVADRPRLELRVSGPGPNRPVAVPAKPVGPRGVLVNGGRDYAELTCDGGRRRVAGSRW